MVLDARCQKKNNKCQLLSAVRPGRQERLAESHFSNSSRSSQISFHLSDIHYFLINAFTLGCGRELGYGQSAKHVIILGSPAVAANCHAAPHLLVPPTLKHLPEVAKCRQYTPIFYHFSRESSEVATTGQGGKLRSSSKRQHAVVFPPISLSPDRDISLPGSEWRDSHCIPPYISRASSIF